MKDVDRIVVLINGKVSEMGTYKELMSNRGAFAEFLETYLQEKIIAEPEEIDEEGLWERKFHKMSIRCSLM